MRCGSRETLPFHRCIFVFVELLQWVRQTWQFDAEEDLKPDPIPNVCRGQTARGRRRLFILPESPAAGRSKRNPVWARLLSYTYRWHCPFDGCTTFTHAELPSRCAVEEADCSFEGCEERMQRKQLASHEKKCLGLRVGLQCRPPPGPQGAFSFWKRLCR
mmetsp:Transcript_25398/g.49618  ORF Transcript_25398/g.49618 Transcript_25398/m.49618 type:complete len:160 (+) Transcript_25398:313-792(+)